MSNYLPQADLGDRDTIIREYFHLGFQYQEIRNLLNSRHGIDISLSHLKREIKRLHLKRRNKTPLEGIVAAVESELNAGNNTIGYRAMHQRLQRKGVRATREEVRLCLREMDPDGVHQRTRRRFHRRTYYCSGPNQVWHIDGYDKLKPYGFAIHGAIDGFSRKVLWLKVSRSNKNPAIIAKYFLEYVKSLSGTAEKVYADPGTENGNTGGIQNFFRRESENPELSYRLVKSVYNQRIESWWGILRRQTGQQWINFFQEMHETGDFSNSDPLQVECMRYCIMPVLQNDLDEIRQLWNTHRIRSNRSAVCPSGIPDHIYHAPEQYNATDYKKPVSHEDVELANDIGADEPEDCLVEFKELADLIMEENGWDQPATREEAVILYSNMMIELNALLP